MIITAIDPGTTESAIVVWDAYTGQVLDSLIHCNEEILACITRRKFDGIFVCEMVACYGMAVGKEVFQTVLWIGRFMQAAIVNGNQFNLVYRQEVKIHHCHSARAKDANVSQALKDRFGQVGTKKNKGPLYGIKSHLWSALAIATYFADTR